MLHSPILNSLNGLIGILLCNRCALDHQVEDGLMRQQECDRMRFTVGKSWDLKLQIYLLEKGCAQLVDTWTCTWRM